MKSCEALLHVIAQRTLLFFHLWESSLLKQSSISNIMWLHKLKVESVKGSWNPFMYSNITMCDKEYSNAFIFALSIFPISKNLQKVPESQVKSNRGLT